MATGQDADLALGDEQAHREEQGVAREEREEQAALDEEHDDADPEQGRAELVKQEVRAQPLGEVMEADGLDEKIVHTRTLDGDT